MIIRLPMHIKFDLNEVPEDLEGQVGQAFAEYTKGTSKAFTYQDKLCFIDHIVEELHKAGDEWDAVKGLLMDRFEYDLDNGFGLPDTDDYDSVEFMQDCYSKGREDGRLYHQFVDDNGVKDHHVYDKIMEIEYRAIKAVIEWEADR
ncbi:MAG: hypothetical protein K6G83_02035 [Lachnospiraceae bacterium]|nr:hypothetical protein [Lachnospiraceae bacterium]